MNQELKIIVRADGTAQVVSQLNTVNASMAGTTAKSATMASTMSTQFGKIASSLGLAALGFAAFRKGIDILRESRANAVEAEIAQRILESQIRATGEAAGRTSAQMLEMATAFERASNYGDEEIIMKVTVPLTTFKEIKELNFDRAQQAILDMATTMSMDLGGAAVMVGKALNDPVKGINAMTRAGVSFTAAEKDVILALAETGRLAEAQTLILQALEGQFKGSAQA